MGTRLLRSDPGCEYLDARCGDQAPPAPRYRCREERHSHPKGQERVESPVLPLNAPAKTAIERMLARADSLGHTEPEHYLWPASQWHRFDPTKPASKWDMAWRALRDAAGLVGLRFHDLRHTVITELLEAGEPDHVVESISGHLSRRMLEHYSHIRIDAKSARAIVSISPARPAAVNCKRRRSFAIRSDSDSEYEARALPEQPT